MEQSILKSTKKILGLAPEFTVFDQDVLTHINTAFSTLTQLGVGPRDGYMIEDDTALWEDYWVDNEHFNAVKTYIYLRVRLVFDPPATSYAIGALEKQLLELEWRLNVEREETQWVDPDPPVILIEDQFEGTQITIIDGGSA